MFFFPQKRSGHNIIYNPNRLGRFHLVKMFYEEMKLTKIEFGYKLQPLIKKFYR